MLIGFTHRQSIHIGPKRHTSFISLRFGSPMQIHNKGSLREFFECFRINSYILQEGLNILSGVELAEAELRVLMHMMSKSEKLLMVIYFPLHFNKYKLKFKSMYSKTKKENLPRGTSQKMHQTLRSSKRNVDSVGKIVRNKSRVICSNNALYDITAHSNNQQLGRPISNSAAKRRQLEQKYKRMVCEYQENQKRLDNRMQEFERNSISGRISHNILCTRKLPILSTSDFNMLGSKILREQRLIRPVTNTNKKLIDSQVKVEIDKRVQQPEIKRRHTEQCLSRSDLFDNPSVKPIQLSQPKPLNVENLQCLKLFISMMKKQIDLEGELRKWKNRVTMKIQQQVQKYLQQKQVPKDILKVQFEEYEVFGREDKFSGDVVGENIVRCYKQCEKHWSEAVLGKLKKEELKKVMERLDYDKTGIITSKILARELSIMTNSNLRVRDVYRICKRISAEESITIGNLIRGLKAQ